MNYSKILIASFALLISNTLSSQDPILCADWLNEIIIDNYVKCGSACPADTYNEGDPLSYEYGYVKIDAKDYLYINTSGGTFDFSCERTDIYELDGLLRESCVSGFGGFDCTLGFFSEDQVLNADYTTLWNCEDGLPNCAGNEVCQLSLCSWVQEEFKKMSINCNGLFTIGQLEINGNYFIEIRCTLGFDASTSNFFDCQGNLMFTCETTIAGTTCNNGFDFPVFPDDWEPLWTGTVDEFPACDEYLCIDWLNELIKENNPNCFKPCPADIYLEGSPLFYQYGLATINSIDYYYVQTSGGTFDFPCEYVDYFNFEGKQVEHCEFNFGTLTCFNGLFDSYDVVTGDYTAYWNCNDGVSNCTINSIDESEENHELDILMGQSEFSLSTTKKIYELRIYNISGQLLIKQSYAKGELISTKYFSAGIYLIHLQHVDGSFVSRKVFIGN